LRQISDAYDRFASSITAAQNSPGTASLAAQRSEVERRADERCVTVSSQRIETGHVAGRDTR
jgi:hypothetical protein